VLVAWAVVPPSAAAVTNDDFAAASSLGNVPRGSLTGSNVDATKQSGEHDHAGNAGGHSVWFSWTAPVDGNESFTTDLSDFDTLLAVYTGAAVNALSHVASTDDLGSIEQSTVSFRVVRGVTYWIAVDGFEGKKGRIDLRWAPAPVNDNFADARPLAGVAAGSVRDSTVGATPEPFEPDPVIARIWYSWTAPRDGTYKFDTIGSSAQSDTVLGVYRGGPRLDSLVRIGINDDDPDLGCCTSWIPLTDATAGTTYWIFVAPLRITSSAARNAVRLNWGPLVLGTDRSETLVGSRASEELRGGAGDDLVRGGGGNDVLVGGSGNDAVYGGAGRDILVDFRGRNRLHGNAGADVLFARSRAADLINGGPGRDRCFGDRHDTERRCP
jgi:hypothetical protein